MASSLQDWRSQSEPHLFAEVGLKLLEDRNTGVLCFGLLLYTEQNPEIRRLLRDPLIFEELDSLSGDRFLILLLRDLPRATLQSGWNPSFERLQFVGDFNAESKHEQQSWASGVLQAFTRTAVPLKYPALLIFALEEGFVTDALLIGLAKPSLHETHEKLKRICAGVSGALAEIIPECAGNQTSIMWNVRQVLETEHFFNEVVPVGKRFIDILMQLKGLSL